MTMMSDLSQDLVEEILCRVPITSLRAVRSTCKGWNTISKTRIICKAEAKHHFLGLMNHTIFSMRFSLNGILKEDPEVFVDPCIKPIGNILQVKISEVFYCDGLLLCVTKDNSLGLLVWNPYLGQTTRWIQPLDNDRTGATYALGYDKNKNHKILRLFDQEGYYEVYDLKSNLWSLFDIIPNWTIDCCERGVSLKGNTYFWSCEGEGEGMDVDEDEDKDEYEYEYDFLLLCFDFTTERFGQNLPLPHFMHCGTLCCVKEEKLGLLYACNDTPLMEIWVTTKIEPNEAWWSKFLVVDREKLTGIGFQFKDDDERFFIDEEKNVAVVFGLDDESKSSMAYIIGDNRCMKKVDLEKVVKPEDSGFSSLVCFCSNYVPSLVQISDAQKEREEEEVKHQGVAIAVILDQYLFCYIFILFFIILYCSFAIINVL